MRHGWRFLLIGLCALAGAALNIYRDVWWNSGGPIVRSGFCAPLELQTRDLNRFANGFCRIDIPEQHWRPLDVTIWMKASDPLPETAAVVGKSGRTIHVSVDDPSMAEGAASSVTVDTVWRPFTFGVTAPPKPQAPLSLILRADQPPSISNPILSYVVAAPIVGMVEVAPRLTVSALAWPAVAGALFGVAMALLVPRRRVDGASRQRTDDGGGAARASAEAKASVAGDVRRGGLAFAVLLIYFAAWAVLRPPYQTPDEPQHHVRTTSVLRDPWFARPGAWDIDPRFSNPIPYWQPPPLFRLYYNPEYQITRSDVRELKGVPWPAPSALPPSEPYERAIASYPTLYYWAQFALGELVTRVPRLTPYDSTFAYRLVSAALAAICWALVFVWLRRLEATRENAIAIGAILVLNPMTAFMSSAINPDAVNIPLAILASLLFWRLLTTGAGEWWTLAALLATAFTKPSGLQLIGALLAAGLALWMLGHVPIARLKTACATLARAAMIAWCAFYAWSPPRFLGEPPSPDTLTTYLSQRWIRTPVIWITYWGKLGWLEYSLAPIWYWLVLAAVLIGIACALWRPRGSRTFMLFAAMLSIAFVGATLAGEFAYLRVAGYILQGRHLLPGSLGLALIVMHRFAPVRIATFAFFVLLNVMLIQATIDRYYGGEWRLAVYTMPFTR
jgi:hypothetical protein